MNTANNIIELSHIDKRYGNKQVLKDLTLKLPYGGIHALVGGNGAGKSTLFRVLLGLVEPDNGSAKVLGCATSGLDSTTRAKIAYVNEDHALPDWLSVEQLVAMQKSGFVHWSDAAYDSVISQFFVEPTQLVGQLSRGERAGLALAMALAQRPQLLLLDEPTLGLDVVARQSFLESLLFASAEHECTIVYCSHHMEEVERIADTLILVEQGSISAQQSPEAFCQRIEYWLAEYEGQPPAPEHIPHLLQMRIIDDMYHYMVMDCDLAFDQLLQDQGATSIMRNPVALDRAVNAFLTRAKHRQALEAGR